MSRSRILCSVLLLAAPSSFAADIFIGGPAGFVFRGDSVAGNFEQFGGAGPIGSMVIHDGVLIVGDTFGNVWRISLSTGQFIVPILFFDSDAAAMAIHNGDLLIADSSGLIFRIDPVTGEALNVFFSPVEISAMTVKDGWVFVAGPEGSVHRSDGTTAGFQYFTCICFAPILSLTADDTHLILGDSINIIGRASLANGQVTGAFISPVTPRALEVDGDVLLIGAPDNSVHRVDALNGSPLSTLATPIAIESIVMMPEPVCPGDLTGNGTVDLNDLGLLLAAFGQDAGGDIDGDGDTTLGDLGILLAGFNGPCP
jgi:hypothetical protein